MLQHPGEFGCLRELYRHRRPQRVLEIGTHEGGTLYHWLHAAAPGATVVSIDLNHERFHVYANERHHDWSVEGVTLVTIPGDSNDRATVGQAAMFAPFDWVFIDADHHERNVRADWELYAPLAAPGAVVAFHDIAPTDDPTIEVDRLWAELKAERETVEFVAEGGFGIGVVHMPRKLVAVPGPR
jgi:predicted O-methyltransferase YrrM